MSEQLPQKASFIEQAIELARTGNFEQAKSHLEFPNDSMQNDEYFQFLIDLDTAIKCFIQGDNQEALAHFKQIDKLIELSEDNELKFVLFSINQFVEGMVRLTAGDAHGAVEYLEFSSDAFKKLSYILPTFEKDAYAARAIMNISIARSYFNAGDLQNTNYFFGKADRENLSLKQLLVSENEDDFGYLANIHGFNIEKAILFGFMELQSLEIACLQERLHSVAFDVIELKRIMKHLESHPLWYMYTIYINIIEIYDVLASVEDEVFFKRSPISKANLKGMHQAFKLLTQNSSLESKTGERGRGIQIVNEQMKKIHFNLLNIGKVRRNDFEKYAGVLSVVCFLILVILTHLLIKPIGLIWLAYYFGALILALIGGFGYGALKFVPLLKTYAKLVETIEPQSRHHS